MGNRAKQVIDFRPSKGFASSTSNEIQRKRSEKARVYAESIGNYDPTREHLNFEIVKGGKIQAVDKTRSIQRRIRENLSERGIRDPNEGLEEPKYRTVVNFILGGSRERMHELAYEGGKVNLERGSDNSHIRRSEEIERWAKDMYEFFAKRYGEDNIASLVVHLDEMNPHCHLTLLPIDERNRFAYKRMFAGKDKYDYIAINHAIHDDLAKVNAKWGLNRGSDIRETGARHRSTEEYRRQLNDDCVSLEDQLCNARKVLMDLNREIRLAETRVKGLTTMVGNLTRQRKELQLQLDRCFMSVADGRTRPEDMADQIEELKRRLMAIESGLADKNAKLVAAKEKLDALYEDMNAAKQKTDELRGEAYSLAEVVTDRYRAGVTDAMYNVLMEEFKHMMAQMDNDTVGLFDDSLLMDFARRGNAIARCAVMLLGGYVNEATQFAQGQGGGGGSDMKWGRDAQEDDRLWARRCVRMAIRMMRPSGKRSRGKGL